MPITIEKLKKLQNLNTFLKDNQMATVKQLQHVLSMSRRSVYNYIDELEDEYEAEIVKENGRFTCVREANLPNTDNDSIINPNDVKKLRDCLDILSNFKHLPQSRDIKLLIRKIEYELELLPEPDRDIIITENNNKYIGWRHFELIYEAIKQQQQVQIIYRPFFKQNQKPENVLIAAGFDNNTNTYNWKINPWLIKEYNNRWQLIGQCDEFKIIQKTKSLEPNGIVNISLDRILNIRLLNSISKPQPADLLNKFDHVVGFSLGEIENVHIWFNRISIPYVKSKPLHWTQNIIHEDEKGAEISLEVVINYELMQELRQYCPNIEILHPLTLRQEFKNTLIHP